MATFVMSSTNSTPTNTYCFQKRNILVKPGETVTAVGSPRPVLFYCPYTYTALIDGELTREDEPTQLYV